MIKITAFYASLLGAFYLYLTVLVIIERRKKGIGIGHGNDRGFHRLVRTHANLNEYVPFILLLMLILEINQVASYWLHLGGATLLIARLLHAFGLRLHAGSSWQRVGGGGLTLLVFAGVIAGNLLLIR